MLACSVLYTLHRKGEFAVSTHLATLHTVGQHVVGIAATFSDASPVRATTMFVGAVSTAATTSLFCVGETERI